MAYTQIQKILSNIVVANNYFGRVVVVDGYHMVVNSENSEAVLYKRNIEGVWDFRTELAGEGVSIAMNGSFIVVSDSNGTTVRVFNKDTSDSTILQTITEALGTKFGSSVAISDNYIIIADQAANTNTGEIFIYEKTGTTSWTSYANNPVTVDVSNVQDFFGSAVATNDESIIVGAKGDSQSKGAVYIFQKDVNTGVWEQTQKIFASDGLVNDQFGESASISEDHFVVGASLKDNSVGEVNSGAAYVFKYSNSWYEVDKLVSVDENSPEGDHFGESVYINGDHIIVGSPAARLDKGVADVFSKKRSWGHLKKIVGSDVDAGDTFGTSVSISGRFIAVGSPLDDDAASDAGAVYMYEDPQVNLRLAQEFEVNQQFLPSKASVYLKRVGENTSNFWHIYNTTKTVIDATNFSSIDGVSNDLTLNTVAQYKMNDNLATTNVINELGPDATNFANTSTKDTTGKINGALEYNAVDDFTNTNQTFQSTFQDSFSINFWIKPDDGQVLGHMCGLIETGTEDFVRIDQSAGNVFFQYGSNGNNMFALLQPGWPDGPVADFHMLTAVIEKLTTGTKISWYYDGSPSGTPTTNLTVDMSSFTNTKDFYIGAVNQIGTPNFYYGGDFDDFRIFDKVLSQDDINFLYNGGVGTEDLTDSNDVIFEDTIGGFTGNGYMIAKESSVSIDYETINYPIRAINPDTYDLWLRVINTSSNSLEIEILIDGNVSKTISTLIDNPSDDLEWSWVNTTLVLPDNRDHILGIRIKENNVAIDKIYIEVDSTTPYTEGPDLSVSPYLTAHMRVYDSLRGEPNAPIFVYDYKNSITEIIQDDWYNFNIKVLDDTHGYITANDFSENYYLVMATSGTNTSNFITWELIDNDEYNATSSAIKF